MNRKTTPDAGSFIDARALARSIRDAMNLVNLRWFVYDRERREAWLARHSNAAADPKPTTERRTSTRRAADTGARVSRPPGADRRHRTDRRRTDHAA